MPKSKAKRGLQGTDNNHVSKKLKSAATITPPPDAGEFKTLGSVGLEEDDLDLAIDTLRTLSENPGVIKSKVCKDLRTAVYEFRQACTTGLNTSGRCLTPNHRKQSSNILKAIPTLQPESAAPLPMDVIRRPVLYLLKCGSEGRCQS